MGQGVRQEFTSSWIGIQCNGGSDSGLGERSRIIKVGKAETDPCRIASPQRKGIKAVAE